MIRTDRTSQNAKTTKIVFCGPPHSGKSVFLQGLTANIPHDDYYLFRACPDGEGTWTYSNSAAAAMRRKGSFTPKQVSWYVDKLRACDLAPVVLVDVGGRMTEDNRRIMSQCDRAVILSGDPEATGKWRSFCKDCGLSVLAEIRSDYAAAEDDSETMTVHHLERGEDSSERPVIKKIAEEIKAIATTIKKTKEMINASNQENIPVINIGELADKLGKAPDASGRITWNPEDLKEVSRSMHNEKWPERVRINGAAPGWLVAALVHEVHPSEAEINSPDGYVTAQCGEPSDTPEGSNLEWEKDEKEDYTLVSVRQKDPSIPLNPDDLPGWRPPKTDMNKPVVVSGRMPNWGMAAISMAYHGKCLACAIFQPQVQGGVVTWTHSQKVNLGEVIGEGFRLGEDAREKKGLKR